MRTAFAEQTRRVGREPAPDGSVARPEFLARHGVLCYPVPVVQHRDELQLAPDGRLVSIVGAAGMPRGPQRDYPGGVVPVAGVEDEPADGGAGNGEGPVCRIAARLRRVAVAPYRQRRGV